MKRLTIIFGYVLLIACTLVAQGKATDTNCLVVTDAGNIGIGIDMPETRLHINGSVRGDHSGALKIDTGVGYLIVGPKSEYFAHIETDRPKFYFNKELRVDTGLIGSYNGDLSLRTAGTTRIKVIESNGYVGIGTNSPETRLHVSGNVLANVYSTPSDQRWKENIETVDNALDVIAQLRGVFYDWIDPSRGEGRQLGVIAQEVEAVLPEVVNTDSQGYKSVQYAKLVAPLIEAVKTLKIDNERLFLENQSLKEANQHIEERLTRIEVLLIYK